MKRGSTPMLQPWLLSIRRPRTEHSANNSKWNEHQLARVTLCQIMSATVIVKPWTVGHSLRRSQAGNHRQNIQKRHVDSSRRTSCDSDAIALLNTISSEMNWLRLSDITPSISLPYSAGQLRFETRRGGAILSSSHSDPVHDQKPHF